MACETLIKSNLWGDNVDAVGVNILSEKEAIDRTPHTHTHNPFCFQKGWEDILLLLHTRAIYYYNIELRWQAGLGCPAICL
jgi:hypothetical protein